MTIRGLGIGMLLGCLWGSVIVGQAGAQPPPLKPLGPGLAFPADAEWINVAKPLSMEELKGKLVLLDFWTYCCINCMHILPVLKEIEEDFENELVVIGVHTAKFETERDTENIREAVRRYDVVHPVLNDANHQLWNGYGVNTWPTLVLLDPSGVPVWSHRGEISFKDLQKVLKRAVSKFSKEISRQPLRVGPESGEAEATPLRFPGKVVADEARKRLFISDTNHHRIIIAKMDGSVERIIGSGRAGHRDGVGEEVEFRYPQGMALMGEGRLYVADTQNHLLRRVDLESGKVSTVAGTGQQGTSAFPGNEKGKLPKKLGRKPLATAIASPWDLWSEGGALWIAMAGPHQIWKMEGDESLIAPVAGNGREDIVDGALLPSQAYALDSSSFAQPSGLASDGKSLFVADSEGSSIRMIPLQGEGSVSTLIGTAKLASQRLFTFGDRDGLASEVLLQHPLGVAFADRYLYIADTYNDSVKRCDMTSKIVTTLVGRKTEVEEGEPLLDEPSGVAIADSKLFIADTNNHRIRVWDLKKERLSTLELKGLEPPKVGKPTRVAKIPEDAKPVLQAGWRIRTGTEKAKLQVDLVLPDGWKLNMESPMGVIYQQREGKEGGLCRGPIRVPLAKPEKEFALEIEIDAKCRWLEVAVVYYYCRVDGAGLCLADTVLFQIPIERGGPTAVLPLRHEISPP